MPYANKLAQKRYQHRHYLKFKDKYRDSSRKTKERKRELVRTLKNKPCMDCEILYPYYVMHFDHRDGKEKIADISDLQWLGSEEVLLTEIAKCDLVCANCHAIRTWKRKCESSSEVERLIANQ